MEDVTSIKRIEDSINRIEDAIPISMRKDDDQILERGIYKSNNTNTPSVHVFNGDLSSSFIGVMDVGDQSEEWIPSGEKLNVANPKTKIKNKNTSLPKNKLVEMVGYLNNDSTRCKTENIVELRLKDDLNQQDSCQPSQLNIQEPTSLLHQNELPSERRRKSMNYSHFSPIKDAQSTNQLYHDYSLDTSEACLGTDEIKESVMPSFERILNDSTVEVSQPQKKSEQADVTNDHHSMYRRRSEAAQFAEAVGENPPTDGSEILIIEDESSSSEDEDDDEENDKEEEKDEDEDEEKDEKKNEEEEKDVKSNLRRHASQFAEVIGEKPPDVLFIEYESSSSDEGEDENEYEDEYEDDYEEDKDEENEDEEKQDKSNWRRTEAVQFHDAGEGHPSEIVIFENESPFSEEDFEEEEKEAEEEEIIAQQEVLSVKNNDTSSHPHTKILLSTAHSALHLKNSCQRSRHTDKSVTFVHPSLHLEEQADSNFEHGLDKNKRGVEINDVPAIMNKEEIKLSTFSEKTIVELLDPTENRNNTSHLQPSNRNLLASKNNHIFKEETDLSPSMPRRRSRLFSIGELFSYKAGSMSNKKDSIFIDKVGSQCMKEGTKECINSENCLCQLQQCIKGIKLKSLEITRRGISRGNYALLHRKAWLEVSDKYHRYGKNLRIYYRHWEKLGHPTNMFFDWLDSKNEAAGEPLPNLACCPRSKVDSDTVLYIGNPEARARYSAQIIPKSGQTQARFIDCDGNILSTGPDGWIFVLRDHEIYISKKVTAVDGKSKNRFHHSSFFGGQAVAAAGILITDENGQLSFLYPHSGHYRPGEAHMQRMLYHLYQSGVDLSSFEVDMQQIIHIVREKADNITTKGHHTAEKIIQQTAAGKIKKTKKTASLHLKPAIFVADFLGHKASMMGVGLFNQINSLQISSSVQENLTILDNGGYWKGDRNFK